MITVRKATASDAEAIARIRIGTWQCAYKGQMPDELLDNLSIDEDIENWKRRIADPPKDKVDFVAVLDGRVIGFASVGPCRDEDMDDSTGEVWALYVDQNFMHHGAGSALMKESISYLRSLGFKKATLWVLDTNEKTIAWYEHKGWRKEGKTKTEEERGFTLSEIRYTISL